MITMTLIFCGCFLIIAGAIVGVIDMVIDNDHTLDAGIVMMVIGCSLLPIVLFTSLRGW